MDIEVILLMDVINMANLRSYLRRTIVEYLKRNMSKDELIDNLDYG